MISPKQKPPKGNPIQKKVIIDESAMFENLSSEGVSRRISGQNQKPTDDNMALYLKGTPLHGG